jgi:hypothetical protein
MWHEPLTMAQLTQAYRLSGSFSDIQIDVFITFALRTRPGTIHLYHSLDSVALSLLRGKVPASLR